MWLFHCLAGPVAIPAQAGICALFSFPTLAKLQQTSRIRGYSSQHCQNFSNRDPQKQPHEGSAEAALRGVCKSSPTRDPQKQPYEGSAKAAPRGIRRSSPTRDPQKQPYDGYCTCAMTAVWLCNGLLCEFPSLEAAGGRVVRYNYTV